jgi:ATP phosphoribosyltransferase
LSAETVQSNLLPGERPTPRSISRAGDDGIRLALPSDGDLYEPALAFLRSCGITVDRPSSRRYMATIKALPGATVLFQRTGDITQKVEEGSAELGITGLDRFLEGRREGSPAVPIIEDLSFGHCDLVMAVPESWLDVVSTDDLADLAVEFRQKGRQLRIATKYPRLLRKFLYSRGINYFSLVQSSGSLEAAPAAGYADVVADLTASGVTLRENRLKTLEDGPILVSQACLIGNRKLLRDSPWALELARNLLEMMEGHLRAGSFYHLTANVRGDSADAVGARVLSRADLAGLEGPTISSVYNVHEEGSWAVSLVVPREQLLEAVDHLRDAGGTDIFASQISYLFKGRSPAYQMLMDRLEES